MSSRAGWQQQQREMDGSGQDNRERRWDVRKPCPRRASTSTNNGLRSGNPAIDVHAHSAIRCPVDALRLRENGHSGLPVLLTPLEAPAPQSCVLALWRHGLSIAAGSAVTRGRGESAYQARLVDSCLITIGGTWPDHPWKRTALTSKSNQRKIE